AAVAAMAAEAAATVVAAADASATSDQFLVGWAESSRPTILEVVGLEDSTHSTELSRKYVDWPTAQRAGSVATSPTTGCIRAERRSLRIRRQGKGSLGQHAVSSGTDKWSRGHCTRGRQDAQELHSDHSRRSRQGRDFPLRPAPRPNHLPQPLDLALR